MSIEEHGKEKCSASGFFHQHFVNSSQRLRRSSIWLQNGCLTAAPILRLGIHPEMERPAILNRSMPSTAGATMSNPAFQRFVDLSMRNTIYMFGRRYSLWRAGLPIDFGPVLTFEGNCSYFRANPAHLVRHLPNGADQCLLRGVAPQSPAKICNLHHTQTRGSVAFCEAVYSKPDFL
jgi:hypothetical protein